MNIDVRTTAHTRIKQRKLIADRARQSVGKDKTPMPPPQQQPPHKRRHIRKAIALVPCIQRAQQASGHAKALWRPHVSQTKASSCGNTFGRQTSLTDLHSAALRQYLFTANNSCCKQRQTDFFCRRNTARIYSAASWQPLCQTQQSAAPLQSSISRRRPYKTKSPHSTHCEESQFSLAKTRAASTTTPSDRVPRFVHRRFGTKKKNLQRLQVLFLQKHFSGDI